VSHTPFAQRTSFDLTPTAFAARVAARRSSGLPLLDLSDANPTRHGLAPVETLRAALAGLERDPATPRYEPDPRGDPSARAAIAAYHARRGARVAPEQVVLTAGTSEGYAHLFRLLGDPGDVVHLPAPGYPLFEHLAALEGLAVLHYPLHAPRRGTRWRIDLDALAATLGPRSRALLAIDPHNPTGSFVDPEDWASLRSITRERGLAIVSDEVFADFAHDAAPPAGALVDAGEGPLHFVLSGASKVLALPQLKIAWIVVAGPAPLRDEALARLEFLADAFLSVSPLLARALPTLFREREAIQRAVHTRVAANRAQLADLLAGSRASPLPCEAGWASIVRVAGHGNEEALVTSLLDRGVLVQPGQLFDLDAHDADGAPCAHLLVSLLLETGEFARGVATLRALLAERRSAASS
jgi:aspartate/methionine/tyrosine aminotransferase